ncbi:MAG: hydantoinase/oxoprolinase family protein [Reyranellaceae bacterium]
MVARHAKGSIVGIDVGGTFTDLIAIEPDSGAVRLAKVPTTLDNQAFGVIAAVRQAGIALPEAQVIVHGTTTTTNALLERKIARIGLITTKGFRDVLELGRRTRPNPYGLKGQFNPLVPRELRLEVPERMSAEGEVIVELDEDAVVRSAATLKKAGCEGIVVHFLHSYLNPAHERRAAELCREAAPALHVTAGHTIVSEYREYERGTTACVNAAVQPVLDRYIRRLRDELRTEGFSRDLLVMQGNGGTISSAMVAEAAVNTVMSGPASGVMAAAYTAAQAGFPNVITYDMGGTSSDVGLIRDGLPQVSAELELEYAMPIHVPMVDVHTIGAGGGSIAFINDAGLLQVGPESAGANPGPMCYGRGGNKVTITDANLLLGRLNPDGLLGVAGTISLDDIRQAFVEQVGARLGLDAHNAAAAVLRVANDRMAGAIRMVSLSRGHDPRDFLLFPFGGAGPLHAAALAQELGIPRLLVPVRPGITNALGCVVSDLRHDFVRTINRAVAAVDPGEIAAVLARQEAEGRATIARDSVATDSIDVMHSADMQFQGQSHILTVTLAGAAPGQEELQAAFERAYWERFEVELPEIRAVLVNLRTAVIGRRPPIELRALAGTAQGRSLAEALTTRRKVWFNDTWLETPVYRREKLPWGATFEGPAIVEQLDTTIVIEPNNSARIDKFGNLIVSVES